MLINCFMMGIGFNVDNVRNLEESHLAIKTMNTYEMKIYKKLD